MIDSNNDIQQKLIAIQNAFPKRTLTLKNAGDGGMLINLIMGITWLILGAGLLVYSGKLGIDALADQKFADNYVIVDDARVEGECKGVRKMPFLEGCDVTITTADGRKTRKDFFFFSTSKDDYEVYAIAQKDDPSNVTIDLAVNRLTSRYVSIAILGILGLLTFFVGTTTLRNIPRKIRLKKIMNAPENQPWQCVSIPVEIYADTSMDYKADMEGKAVPVSIDIEKHKPFILGEAENGDVFVLAIKAKNAATCVPLTQELNALDLSHNEKVAILNEIDKLYA